ncbi:PspA-associated protein PspAA [Methanococcoides methylutens]|uniref:PspA-associated protein PspAA n=1 Tax=Methanococcoides methylutens TaxID=2226 RepID=UPI0040448225
MIIRIMGEGQYEVPGSLFDELNIIDNRIVDLVGKENEADYRTELLRLIHVIKSNGKQLDDASIVESNIIVPPEDLSLQEAKEIFTGSGLLED